MDAKAAQFLYPWRHGKVVHLVRHGQAMHNVEGDKNREALLSQDLFDAQLSPLGLQQVAKLRKDVHASGLLDRIELVITSPLSRAMQTAIGVFGSDRHPKVMAIELCRDRLGVRPCDMRRKISDYRSRFPTVDFSMMDVEDDTLWNPDVRESEEELAARGARFLKWLWTRPEKEIVVVSHGIVLQNILINIHRNDCNLSCKWWCKRFDHCELRSVFIMDQSIMGKDSASLCSDHHHQDDTVLKQGSFPLISLADFIQ
ncbi:phosphoglycerate mutase-like protein 1 isoform X2 [Herrania umbratica]|uniref:Phosphoglycerate mutase-like protein 1 isoform X2 n=1 Tax=Herrania umbratica TaxID=108875 RepID=A0A6J1AQ57_9ROSI|nr:phosphoglycerate mutase-like protein 1 isoform X2 [Herrania umbratica]